MEIIDISGHELKDMGLSDNIVMFMSECLQFCLLSQNHNSGVTLKVLSNGEMNEYSIIWELRLSQTLHNSMNDEDRTTDFGAMGLSLLLAAKRTSFRYFVTSMKKNGFDFFLFEEEPDELDLTKASACLEVSGIRIPTRNNSMEKRLHVKRSQVSRYGFSQEAFISIIGFKTPESIFECLS